MTDTIIEEQVKKISKILCQDDPEKQEQQKETKEALLSKSEKENKTEEDTKENEAPEEEIKKEKKEILIRQDTGDEDKQEIELSEKVDLEEDNKIILGTYEECPDFLKDNEFIKKGYRLNCNTITKALKSLCICHNESINVWSHLLGLIMVVGLIVYTTFSVLSDHYDRSFSISYKKLIDKYNTQKKEWDVFFNEIKGKYSTITIDKLSYIKDTSISFFKNPQNLIQIKGVFNEYIHALNNLISLELFEHFDAENPSSILELNKIQNKYYALTNTYENLLENDPKVLIDNAGKNDLEIWPIYIMLVSSIFCLGCSAQYHLFSVISEKANSVLSRLDYASISILISGSCWPPYYYFFYCEKCI